LPQFIHLVPVRFTFLFAQAAFMAMLIALLTDARLRLGLVGTGFFSISACLCVATFTAYSLQIKPANSGRPFFKTTAK
jgi:hypothetical protein